MPHQGQKFKDFLIFFLNSGYAISVILYTPGSSTESSTALQMLQHWSYLPGWYTQEVLRFILKFPVQFSAKISAQFEPKFLHTGRGLMALHWQLIKTSKIQSELDSAFADNRKISTYNWKSSPLFYKQTTVLVCTFQFFFSYCWLINSARGWLKKDKFFSLPKNDL